MRCNIHLPNFTVSLPKKNKINIGVGKKKKNNLKELTNIQANRNLPDFLKKDSNAFILEP